MLSRITDRTPLLALLAGLACLTTALPAQVTEWHFFKGSWYWQNTSNVQPTTPEGWSAGAWIVTSSPGDAGLITISGGNINGSLPLQYDGDGEWFLEREYLSQAAMNAEFPSNATYTLVLSGGTLGVQTQTVSFGAEQYPNTPYLTGSSLATARQLNVTSATTLTWNHPGPLTQASGLTVLEIEPRSGNQSFEELTTGAATSTTVPANTLAANECHWGWLEFTNTVSVPAGGFGIAGMSHHTRGTDFEVRTWPFPTAPCAWRESYGVGCAGLELTSNDPILGTTWNLTTNGMAAGTFAVTYFSFGPQQPVLPLSAFGINAPGCVVGLDANSIIANAGGLAAGGSFGVNIALPAAQSLGGIVFYAQTVAVTPSSIGTSGVIEAMLGN